jgi:hypothetical protein
MSSAAGRETSATRPHPKDGHQGGLLESCDWPRGQDAVWRLPACAPHRDHPAQRPSLARRHLGRQGGRARITDALQSANRRFSVLARLAPERDCSSSSQDSSTTAHILAGIAICRAAMLPRSNPPSHSIDNLSDCQRPSRGIAGWYSILPKHRRLPPRFGFTE